jgi:crotonobetainyl-CoA:carnitine CoA-transferase CaiB-like acyl-CoA transferase
LLREGIYTLSFDYSFLLRMGLSLGVADRTSMGNPCINSYRDRDGRWFWIVGLDGERHWPPLCRVVGHPEWIDAPRFAAAADRAANAVGLIAMLDEIFATRTRDEWGVIFDAEQDMWWAPVQSLDEALADPQVTAAGSFIEVSDGEGTMLLPATPVDFENTPEGPRSAPPGHGEHTDEVLAGLGYDRERISELRERGAVA